MATGLSWSRDPQTPEMAIGGGSSTAARSESVSRRRLPHRYPAFDRRHHSLTQIHAVRSAHSILPAKSGRIESQFNIAGNPSPTRVSGNLLRCFPISPFSVRPANAKGREYKVCQNATPRRRPVLQTTRQRFLVPPNSNSNRLGSLGCPQISRQAPPGE